MPKQEERIAQSEKKQRAKKIADFGMGIADLRKA